LTLSSRRMKNISNKIRKSKEKIKGGKKMDEGEAKEILKDTGTIMTDGHFVLNSGKHTSVYIDKFKVLSSPLKTYKLCKGVAKGIKDKGIKIEVVAGPTVGGASIAGWISYHLNMLSFYEDNFEEEILTAFAEKKPDGTRFFRQAHRELIPGKKVLVVDDTSSTGDTVKEVVKAVENLGGEVVALAILCNRGGITAKNLKVPELFALTNISLETWTEEGCPLCAKGVPINTEVGKGREYLARKADRTKS